MGLIADCGSRVARNAAAPIAQSGPHPLCDAVHIPADTCRVILLPKSRERFMFFLIDALLILAMLFFLLLPITDRRTVRMRLCMICALLAVFSVSVTRAPVVPVLPESIASPPD